MSSSYNLNGGDVLVGINREFSNPDAGLSFPLSDLINLWGYGLEEWNTQIVPVDDNYLLEADKDPLSALKGNLKYQYKWKSDEGSSLVLGKTSTKDSDADHDYQKNMAITFKSSVGDQMTWVGTEKNWWLDKNNTNPTDTYCFRESGSISYKYLGELADKTDDMTIKFTFNNSGKEKLYESGETNELYKITDFSISIKSNDVNLSSVGTITKQEMAGESYYAKHLISKYIFQDKEQSFSISFSGNFQEYGATYADVTLAGYSKIKITNLNVQTSDYKMTTTVLNLMAHSDEMVEFNIIPDNNYQQIISSYYSVFEKAAFNSNNIITVMNPNGAVIDGGAGADKIKGGVGDDAIAGGEGKDILTGGAGEDTFVFYNDLILAKDKDVITDFTRGSDLIALKGAVFEKFASNQVESSNIAVGKTADMQKLISSSSTVLYFNTDNKTLYYDGDGNGSALKPIEIVTLTGVATLDASDFIIF